VKDWIPVLIVTLWFSLGDLADIATTLMFLGSPYCIETNSFFAPFSNAPMLLAQAYFSAWFIPVAISFFFYLAIKHVKLHWIFGMFWYWTLILWGFQHSIAAVHNYQILPLCWK